MGHLVWQRPLNAYESSWGYLHTFDVNAAYLAAAAAVELAHGPLQHTGPAVFDAARPGYWLVSLDAATMAYENPAERPPLVAVSRRDPSAPVWMTTPYAKLLQDMGKRFDVLDSWTCGQRSRVLRRWAEQMRDARTQLARRGDSLGRQLVAAVKATYTAGIGGMQREGMRIERPDWGHAVVDQARATLYRRIREIRATQGVWPVRVNVDSVTYADSSADWSTLGQALGVPRPGQDTAVWLGKFRHTATATTREWIAASRPLQAVRP